MMLIKPLIMFCLALTVLAKDMYTDKYDNINPKEILETKRLLNGYFNCAMDRGKCTPQGKELRDNLNEALETGCEKCTAVQKDKSLIVIEYLIEHEREMWNELCAKYDPDGKYRKIYEEEARKKGIKIPKD